MTSTPQGPDSPRAAATVVVCRPASDGRGVEVLLVQRHAGMAFMGGAHVFPGGRVDDVDDTDEPFSADTTPATLAPTASRQVPHFADLDARSDRRHRAAAIRELLEEAGVLLAHGPLGVADAPTAARVRAALSDGVTLPAALTAEGLRASGAALIPLAHWVTPALERRRFDTRFYLAVMPSTQVASHDGSEATAIAWMSPADALAQAARGTMRLPPPTWTTLATLAPHTDLASLTAWARGRTIVRIEPRMHHDAEGCTVSVLPGDPTFPAPEGWETPGQTRFRLGADGWWTPEPRD